MTIHTFDPTLFRKQFPYFADSVKYPDTSLQICWDIATLYVTDTDYCLLNGDRLQLALNLMTAHIAYLNKQLLRGLSPVGPITASTIDKVSVTIATPPIKTAWQQWLSTSPYGLQLWALLSLAAAGGIVIGGRPERSGFRKVGGFF